METIYGELSLKKLIIIIIICITIILIILIPLNNWNKNSSEYCQEKGFEASTLFNEYCYKEMNYIKGTALRSTCRMSLELNYSAKEWCE